MAKPSVVFSKIKKISLSGVIETDDLLASEEPLEIRIGYGPPVERLQKNISVTMRTPGNDFELALGFLFTEGIIKNTDDIAMIRYCTEANTLENHENIVRAELKEHVLIDLKNLERNFYTTSSCGVCGKASIDAVRTVCEMKDTADDLKISPEIIYTLPDKLRKRQNVFEYTGGLHACALFDLEGNLVITREDVGRHNALDKLIGACLGIEPISNVHFAFHNHILLLSGRGSFELIQKAAMAGIKIVAAIGAPSSLAVAMAKEFGITLIGFLRGEHFNVYAGEQRIATS
jgi:FdhD protein